MKNTTASSIMYKVGELLGISIESLRVRCRLSVISIMFWLAKLMLIKRFRGNARAVEKIQKIRLVLMAQVGMATFESSNSARRQYRAKVYVSGYEVVCVPLRMVFASILHQLGHVYAHFVDGGESKDFHFKEFAADFFAARLAKNIFPSSSVLRYALKYLTELENRKATKYVPSSIDRAFSLVRMYTEI